ncbi:MAG: 50S ribosomal protein L5 [Patescibacteria group bacterium]
MSFQEYYNSEIKPQLMKDLNVKNPMALPMIKKVVINVGVGEAVSSKTVIQHVVDQITLIAGQKPVVTKARKSVSAFKVRKGIPLGVKVTLRGKRMYEFIEKLTKIVIPRLRDFRGINDSTVDSHGNLNLGFTEQTLFPEIEFDKVDKIRGLEVTIVTSAKDQQQGRKLFELLGVPFRKDSAQARANN